MDLRTDRKISSFTPNVASRLEPAPVTLMSGAEPWSHDAAHPGAGGIVLLHGFGGTPSAVKGLAHACASAGLHVEVPLLPGHGTTVADMVPTRWRDWSVAAANAYDRAAARSGGVVVGGQSMGASLALWTALRRPAAGIVCINPVTRPAAADELEQLDELLDDGFPVVPAAGGDIADPDAVENAYASTPVAAARSFQVDGLAVMAGRYGELRMPLRLFTSRQDHVIDAAHSEHLASTYGGAVEHSWLERSYHVATHDFDRELLATETVAFTVRVTSS